MLGQDGETGLLHPSRFLGSLRAALNALFRLVLSAPRAVDRLSRSLCRLWTSLTTAVQIFLEGPSREITDGYVQNLRYTHWVYFDILSY
jgi:hypothetical protein